MKRDIFNQLVNWKNSKRRKPLVLKGARQVGKTYILQAFGNEEYEDIAYFNFEEDPNLQGIFSGRLLPDRIIQLLSIYREQQIRPGSTLIICRVPPYSGGLSCGIDRSFENVLFCRGNARGSRPV